MNKLTDKDLREALHRREARRAKMEVPADFCDNIMQEIAPKPARKARYAYIAALAAAACIALAVMLTWPKDGEQKYYGGDCTGTLRTSVHQLTVRKEQTPSPLPVDKQGTTSRVLPAKAAVRQARRTDRQLVVQQNAATAADSLDYYISKIERELAQVDDSLYIERIHRVMHADERLQRIVNSYILNELHKDAQPHQATINNNVKTDEDEE